MRSTVEGGPEPYIQIGTQKWQRRNLDVSTYRNGDVIPYVKDGTAWANLTTGAWCWYNNDPELGKVCGKLYNWYAVNDSRGLAPKGWHISTDAEWTTITDFLGGEFIAGGALKSTTGWNNPNSATNSSGFTGLPGGARFVDGSFNLVGYYGIWWSASEYDSTYAWTRTLYYNLSYVDRNYGYKTGAFSVRCIKD